MDLTLELKNLIDKTTQENPELSPRQIAKKLNLDPDELREAYIRERQEEIFKEAEKTSRNILQINLDDPEIEHKYGKAKVQLLKIKQAEAQFILETLGKDLGYSKRSEITGKNGEEIRIGAITFNAPLPNAKI